MLFTDKILEIREYPINKDYGDDESFFRIITESGEVQLPKLQFQMGKELPDTLSCRIKGYNGSVPVLGHNMPRYVSDFYADGFSKGQEFEFRVIGLPEDSKGHYRLCDDNGLIFKLHEPKTALTKGQSVKCKFEGLDQNVFILKRSNTDDLLPMLTLRDFARIAAIHGVNAQKIEAFLRTIPEMEAAFDELNHGRTVWVVTAIRALRPATYRLFCSATNQYPHEMVSDAIAGYRNVLLYLLQGSGFMRNLKGKERTQLQDEITAQLDQLDIFNRTLNLIVNRGQHKFIRDLLSNLKESGYIYHPTTQFSIMMILFRMSPELVNSSLGGIFDTLMGWDPETWKTEPFRQAFVEQLEIYITETREDIDSFLEAESSEDNEKIEKVLTSIAIQQQLALPSDSIDLRLNTSLFYRYLSLLRTTKADVLLNKSYLALMGVKLPTDFTWSDIKEPTMMMTRAAVDPPENALLPESPRYYINEDMGVDVEISRDGIVISKVSDDAINVVPNGFLPWPNLMVNVDLDRSFNRQKMKTMDGHAEFWTSVENALFLPEGDTKEQVTSRRTPDIDDTVRIIVDKVIPSATDYNRIEAFHCRIVDDHFIEADGYLPADQIVNYNLHGVTVGTFRFDTGEPMRFDAQVIDIDDNDRYIFSLADSTHRAIRDMANAGEKCNCVVTKDNGRSYSAISEKGFGLYINKENDGTPPYHRGNVLRVTITGYDNDAIQSVVDEGPLDIFFSNPRALHNLLLTIAIDSEGNNNAPEIDLDEEDYISREDMREVIEILRYKAVATRDNILMAFDYLCYARLMAIIINDVILADTLKAHKDILLQHHYYAKNKQIYPEQVEAIINSAPESVLIQRLASRLLIVAALGHNEENERLWHLVNNSPNDMERELAQTVLSYNLLNELNHDDSTASAIKDNIAKRLNVNSEQRSLKYYGSESQYVEFKSSLVYPAQKGRSGISLADPDKQEFEILHIIAGFLNSTGGTLYIGVSDDHYERGLEDDFNFYKLDTSERNNKYRRSIRSLDNLANYLQQLIDRSFSLGKIAGDYAVASIDEESVKGVLAVKVAPCPHVVTLNDAIYVRHSAKTEPLTKKEEIDIFKADREKLYRQLVEASASSEVETVEATQPDIPKVTDMPVDETPVEDETPENAFSVATSLVRPNILHEYTDPDHFVPPTLYIRFIGDNDYILTTDEWSIADDDRLVLTVTTDEEDAYLLMVYDDNYAIKVRMRDLFEKGTNTPLPHYSDRKLVFACPVDANGGLYTLHANSKDTLYERVTPIDRIISGSMSTAPERILEAESSATPYIEYVRPEKMADFASVLSTGMKRTQLGALAKGSNVARTTVKEIKSIITNTLKY